MIRYYKRIEGRTGIVPEMIIIWEPKDHPPDDLDVIYPIPEGPFDQRFYFYGKASYYRVGSYKTREGKLMARHEARFVVHRGVFTKIYRPATDREIAEFLASFL